MTEEIIIDIDLKQDNDSFAKLAQLKSAILTTKQEAASLQKAYKDGNITLKEYTTEVVRLEANQKKLAASYTQVQRGVTGLKSPFDQLNQSIKDQAKQVSVAGVSLSSFANPVTATIAVLGGLFKAYASSTIGAKDLEFASNQLGTATTILGNKFAALFSGVEDGEGIFTGFTTAALAAIDRLTGTNLTGASLQVAAMIEKLQDAQREEIKIRGENSDRLEDNAEILTQLNLGQKSVNEKASLYDDIISNLQKNQSEIVRVKELELKATQEILDADKENEDKQAAVLVIQKDLNRESARAERLIQAQIRARDNLFDVQAKTFAAEKKNNDETERAKGRASSAGSALLENDIKLLDVKKAEIELGPEYQKLTEDKAAASENLATVEGVLNTRFIAQQAGLAALSQTFGTATKFFKEGTIAYKAIAIAQITIDTIRASIAALAPPPIGLGPVFGPIVAGITIATGAAAAAKVSGILEGFATGGRVTENHGTPIQRSNGDNRVVTVKTNEAILNETQIQRLGGPVVLAAIGVPGYSPTRTGFITGGMLGAETRNAFSSAQSSQTQLRLLHELKKMKIAVVIEDIDAKQSQRAQIAERATL